MERKNPKENFKSLPQLAKDTNTCTAGVLSILFPKMCVLTAVLFFSKLIKTNKP